MRQIESPKFFAVFSAISWNFKAKFYRHIYSSNVHITVLSVCNYLSSS